MANYELFKKKIEHAEGGFQLLTEDNGNYNSLDELVGTNKGVSAVFYEQVTGIVPTIADMKAITQNQAHELFKNHFWDEMLADNINSQKIAETLTDHAINAGNGSAVKVMQHTLNDYFGKSLSVDGGMGILTLTALNSVDDDKLFIAFSQERISDYNTKKDCPTFCNIWHNRVENLAIEHDVNLDANMIPLYEDDSKKKVMIAFAIVGILAFVIVKRKKNKK